MALGRHCRETCEESDPNSKDEKSPERPRGTAMVTGGLESHEGSMADLGLARLRSIGPPFNFTSK